MSKTFVLMHGAWHGGWCWKHVAGALRARGHQVTTPTQTGLGERRHLISGALSLQTFIDDLVYHILTEDLTDVTMVGHSFGGNAVSGAAEAIPDRIKEAIYLDSTLLLSGESLLDKLPAGELADRILAISEAGDEISVPPPPVSAFGVTDPAQVAEVQPRLTPHPVSTMVSPLPIKGPPGNGLPARYIACTNPIYHPRDKVRSWIGDLGWQVDELATGHDAMITAPDALVEVLDR